MSAPEHENSPLPGLISTREAAALAGVKMSTLRAYAVRGQAPQPVSIPPIRDLLWRKSEIETWIQDRPGKGARTDLRKPGE